jgi:hypothetical protein
VRRKGVDPTAVASGGNDERERRDPSPEAIRAILNCLGIPTRAPPIAEAASDEGAPSFDTDPWSDRTC